MAFIVGDIVYCISDGFSQFATYEILAITGSTYDLKVIDPGPNTGRTTGDEFNSSELEGGLISASQLVATTVDSLRVERASALQSAVLRGVSNTTLYTKAGEYLSYIINGQTP